MNEGGVEALTLRAAARRADVSPAAPYRHFSDKAALLAAVAQQGFERITQAMNEQVEAAPDPISAFRNTGIAYVKFAVLNAAHFRVMFGPEVADRTQFPSMAAAATEALMVQRACVVACHEAGVLAEGAGTDEVAIASWSFIHGLASLVVAGQLPADADAIAPLIDRVGRFLFFGVLAGR
jgi:AcrR family transcriptional regulator